MGVRVMQQAINAGHNFDGSAPAGTAVLANDMEAYPAGNTGGLFDFGITEPLLVYSVQLVLGGQSSWTLSIVDVDNIEVVVFRGTNEASFVTTAADRVLIHQGEKLKLVTSGASGAMRARIAVATTDHR